MHNDIYNNNIRHTTPEYAKLYLLAFRNITEDYTNLRNVTYKHNGQRNYAEARNTALHNTT